MGARPGPLVPTLCQVLYSTHQPCVLSLAVLYPQADTPAGEAPAGDSEDDVDLYDTPWDSQSKGRHREAPALAEPQHQEQQQQQQAQKRQPGFTRLRKLGTAAVPAQQLATEADGTPGQPNEILSAGRAQLNLQDSRSPVAERAGSEDAVAPGAAVPAAAAAKPRANPFARLGGAAKSSVSCLVRER